MELCDINQPLIEQTARKIRVRIHENAYPQDVPAEPRKKFPGFLQRAVTPALVPEIDPEGIYPYLCEFIRILRGRYSADLEGGMVWGKKPVEELQHG